MKLGQTFLTWADRLNLSKKATLKKIPTKPYLEYFRIWTGGCTWEPALGALLLDGTPVVTPATLVLVIHRQTGTTRAGHRTALVYYH